MSHDAWVFLGLFATGILTTIGGAVTAYFGYKTKAVAAEAQKTAKEARDFAAPTGNGFADFVKSELREIRRTGERTERKVDAHLMSHAENDVRRS